MIRKDRGLNAGVTVKGRVVTGKRKPAYQRLDEWDTPDGMNPRKIYSRLCDYGQRGGCVKCPVMCRFGDAWVELGMPEKYTRNQPKGSKDMQDMMVYPQLADVLNRKCMTGKDLAVRIGMSEGPLWNRLKGRTPISDAEKKKIKEALGLAMDEKTLFRRDEQ